MFKGTATAVVTPFRENGVDFENFERFLNFQIQNGVNALVVLGTTGEAPSVTPQERIEIIKCAIKTSSGRVPVIVGTGANSTASAVFLTDQAFALGADGVLVVTPYYNKPTQEGLFRHYSAVSDAANGPVIIYNVPGRTGVNILPETVLRCMRQNANIAGIKEASGSMAQIDELLIAVKKERQDFCVFSGNDDQNFHIINSGGDGAISVLSNVMPRETSDMVNCCMNGDVMRARELHRKMFSFMKNLFIETNPIPVKYAVSCLGFCENVIRLPLVEASEKCRAIIDANMRECGVKI